MTSEEWSLFAFFVIFVLVVMVPVGIVLSMPLGVLLSPLAALICYSRARSIGLPPGYYARIGALYSTILFLPWIYLIVRMFGKTVPSILIGIGYFILYAVWFFGSTVVISFVTLGYGIVALGFSTDIERTYVQILGFCMLLALLCINVVTWVVSMVRLDRFHRSSIPSEGILPNRAYIMPFAYALIWIAVSPILWYGGISILSDGWSEW